MSTVVRSHSGQATVPISAKDPAVCVKGDQFGQGADIYTGKTNIKRCTVTVTVSYLVSHGHIPGPFFLVQGWKSLSKPWFVKEVKKGLALFGLNQRTFSGHTCSFCTGAAIALAQAAVPNSIIQTLGRWNTAVFT